MGKIPPNCRARRVPIEYRSMENSGRKPLDGNNDFKRDRCFGQQHEERIPFNCRANVRLLGDASEGSGCGEHATETSRDIRHHVERVYSGSKAPHVGQTHVCVQHRRLYQRRSPHKDGIFERQFWYCTEWRKMAGRQVRVRATRNGTATTKGYDVDRRQRIPPKQILAGKGTEDSSKLVGPLERQSKPRRVASIGPECMGGQQAETGTKLAKRSATGATAKPVGTGRPSDVSEGRRVQTVLTL